MGEFLFNVILLLFFIAMTFATSSIQVTPDDMGARYWPMFLLIAVIVLLIIKIVRIYKAIPAEQRRFTPDFSLFGHKNVQLLLMSFAWLAIYAAVLPYLGYILSTFLFCVGMTWILGLRKPALSVLIGLGITAALFAIFVWGLGIHPPRGIGVLEDMTKWLEYLFG